MAKHIKVIKCPQCGSTTPTLISDDHYRCDKCGTEFFLDNDDININVKHQYGIKNTDIETNVKKGILIVIISIIALFFIMGIDMCSSMFRSESRTSRAYTSTNKNEYREYYNGTVLLSIKNQAVLFYQSNRNYFHRDDSKNVNYFVFRDVKTGKIIKEYEVKIKFNLPNAIKGRSFERNNGSFYLTIEDRLIYKLIPDKYEVEDVTDYICSRKPALNTGLSAVYILNSNQGDGFRLITNLGKEFYYFPKTNSLYTEEAFNYIANGGMETLTPEATDEIYYLFDKRESKSSNSVIRIMEVKYKFNNGDPQSLTRNIFSYDLNDLKRYRITSYKPITDEFIAFEPQILYYDSSYILISFNATMANDTPSKVQLLTTKGEVLWTTTFDFELKCLGIAARTDSGYMLQTQGNEFYEISLDGKTKTKYTLPETNK